MYCALTAHYHKNSEVLGCFVMTQEHIFSYGMHEETDLVELWLIHNATQNFSLMRPGTDPAKLLCPFSLG